MNNPKTPPASGSLHRLVRLPFVIRRFERHDIHKYPCNSTRLLLPTIYVIGWPRSRMQVTLGFWIWRMDFEVLPNVRDQGSAPRTNAATKKDQPNEN
jgi:hypothetical protein